MLKDRLVTFVQAKYQSEQSFAILLSNPSWDIAEWIWGTQCNIEHCLGSVKGVTTSTSYEYEL